MTTTQSAEIDATQNLIDTLRKHTGLSEEEARALIVRSLDRALGKSVTPPVECANPECDHDRSIPSPGCARRPIPPEASQS